MLKVNDGFNLNITLKDEVEHDLVVISLENGCQMQLSPHQARILATRLIMAASRAEVRHNLKDKDHFSRKAALVPAEQGSQGNSLSHSQLAGS
jgi:hypothetical protein